MIDETDYKAIQKRVSVDAPLDHLGLAEQFAVRHWRESTVDVLTGHDKDGNAAYAPPCPAYAYDKLRGCHSCESFERVWAGRNRRPSCRSKSVLVFVLGDVVQR